MPRIKITVAYVGTHYHGWQMQARKDREHPPTIQEILEKAASHIVGSAVHIQGSGRTDSGVHADAQTAHFDIPENRKHIPWTIALNTLLPHDIRVINSEIAADNFDACRDIYRKVYIYTLWLDKNYTPPRLFPFVWSCGKLNFSMVDACVPYLIGTHDFACFQNKGTPVKSTVRTLYSITRTKAEQNSAAGSFQNLIQLRFEADGYLKQMVRNLTGLLIYCGQGKFLPENIPNLFLSGDRRLAPPTAPPQGLCLSRVWYKGEPMPPDWNNPPEYFYRQ